MNVNVGCFAVRVIPRLFVFSPLFVCTLLSGGRSKHLWNVFIFLFLHFYMHGSPSVSFFALVTTRYFCRVCSTLDVDPSDLNAISVVCVILAAKYEERSSKIPSYSDLLHFIPNEFKSAKSLARWELRVLSVLQWECHCNTAAHFLNLLLSVLENSLGNQFDSLRHLALDLLQNLLLWYPTILTRPSFLASGVVAAARQMLGMPWERVGRRWGVECGMRSFADWRGIERRMWKACWSICAVIVNWTFVRSSCRAVFVWDRKRRGEVRKKWMGDVIGWRGGWDGKEKIVREIQRLKGKWGGVIFTNNTKLKSIWKQRESDRSHQKTAVAWRF